VSYIQINPSISSAVFEYFAARPEGPIWNLERALKTAPQNVVFGLKSLLDAISNDEVLEVKKGALFHHLCEGSVDADRAARIWFAERLLSNEIARRKLALVRSGGSLFRGMSWVVLIPVAIGNRRTYSSPDRRGLRY
jgi:hypothetical protein